jgi:ABC-type sugar transport system ATPase subunit
MNGNGVPNFEVRNISKFFGSVIALSDVSMSVYAGEVMCLLGDNGAGKSTLIKTLAGVHQQSEGQYFVEGEEVRFNSPRDALARGIATVYQDLAMIPLMSISRNFFLGSEPTKGWGPFKRRIGADQRLGTVQALQRCVCQPDCKRRNGQDGHRYSRYIPTRRDAVRG